MLRWPDRAGGSQRAPLTLGAGAGGFPGAPAAPPPQSTETESSRPRGEKNSTAEQEPFAGACAKVESAPPHRELSFTPLSPPRQAARLFRLAARAPYGTSFSMSTRCPQQEGPRPSGCRENGGPSQGPGGAAGVSSEGLTQRTLPHWGTVGQKQRATRVPPLCAGRNVGVHAGEKSAHHRGSLLRCGAAPRSGSGQERGPSFAADRCTSVVLLSPVESSSGLCGAVSTLKMKHLRLDRVM